MTPRMDLQSLIDQPRERLEVEYKSWWDLEDRRKQEALAKALMAMANHGGGYVVLGMAESGAVITSVPPSHATEITQDAVNNIARRYAEPSFQCEVHFVTSNETHRRHPVIVVPGGMREPVMSKRDGDSVRQYAVYMRKSGPQSEEPRNAGDWRELLNRCVLNRQEELLNAIRTAISPQSIALPTSSMSDDLLEYCADSNSRWSALVEHLPSADPARFPDGYWEVGLAVMGTPPINGLAQLRSKIQEAERVVFSGWPLFNSSSKELSAPHPIDQYIEAWLGHPDNQFLNVPQLCDFWRAATDGKLYSIRGYTEDGSGQLFGRPGHLLDVALTIRRIAESLLFADRFCSTCDQVSEIGVRYRFTGLKGRRLSLLRWNDIPEVLDRTCRTDSVAHALSVTPERIRDNLAEVVQTLLLPLCEMFDFYQLPMELVQHQLTQTLAQS